MSSIHSLVIEQLNRLSRKTRFGLGDIEDLGVLNVTVISSMEHIEYQSGVVPHVLTHASMMTVTVLLATAHHEKTQIKYRTAVGKHKQMAANRSIFRVTGSTSAGSLMDHPAFALAFMHDVWLLVGSGECIQEHTLLEAMTCWLTEHNDVHQQMWAYMGVDPIKRLHRRTLNKWYVKVSTWVCEQDVDNVTEALFASSINDHADVMYAKIHAAFARSAPHPGPVDAADGDDVEM